MVRAVSVPALTPAHFPPERLTLAVFGPGTGEAQLVRFPDGSFGVLDGCRPQRGGWDPVARLLEVCEPRPTLRFVGLTHPHADHFGGLEALIRHHTPELLVWAGTEHKRFRDHFVRALREESAGDPSPPDPGELRALLGLLARQARPRGRGAPRSRPIVLSDHKRVGAWGGVSVWGVLPTSAALLSALSRGSWGYSPPKQPDVEPAALKEGNPNDISGALLLEWGQARVLLGGDALNGHPRYHIGWACAPVAGHVQVVKVAHHGSSGAFDPARWAELAPQVAIVTPYQRAAGMQPPQEDMLARLHGGATRLLLTAQPSWWPGVGLLRVAEGQAPWAKASAPRGSPLTHVPGGARAELPLDPASAVAVTLTEDGQLEHLVCAGHARELTLPSVTHRP